MSNLATLDLAKQGTVYHASNQAAVTLSGLSTTATGLILTNPFGSNKNIAVMDVIWAFQAQPAGASVVGIAMSPAVSSTQVTHTTPINKVQSGLLNGTSGQSVGLVDTAATTVGTPVMVRIIGGPNVTAGTSLGVPYFKDSVDGSLILVPGTSIQLAFITTAAVGLGSITWLEYTP